MLENVLFAGFVEQNFLDLCLLNMHINGCMQLEKQEMKCLSFA